MLQAKASGQTAISAALLTFCITREELPDALFQSNLIMSDTEVKSQDHSLDMQSKYAVQAPSHK